MARRDARVVALVVVVVAIAATVALSIDRSDRLLAGERGPSFGHAPVDPTAREGESRLWFADGDWWGVLYQESTGTYRIARLDKDARRWVFTDVDVDKRDTAQVDVLWDAGVLDVVSAGTDPANERHAMQASRFAYDPATRAYSLLPGYPVQITPGGVADLSLAGDGRGARWVTFTEGGSVRVAHTLGDGAEWTTPFVLPVPGATGLLADDRSAVVGMGGGGIGVMWSAQGSVEPSYRFAMHRGGDPDDVWTSSVPLSGPGRANSHIFLVGLPGDPAGRVLALLKTSLTQPDDPLYRLMQLRPDGTWVGHTVWRVADEVRNARISVDATRRRVYAYAATPCCVGGSISFKEADLDRISFEPGRARPIIAGEGVRATTPTSTAQLLDAASGLVVLASDMKNRRYVYAVR